jgi:uncharacterized protein YxeA
MKTLLILISIILFFGCSTVKNATSERFIPMVKIKADYQLTEKQCKELYNWAYRDSFESYYNCGTDQRLFTPNFDYSKIKR